jgi:hypothetical protein
MSMSKGINCKDSPFMVLHETDHIVCLCELDELVVVLQGLDSGFGDENVHFALDCVFCNVVVGVYE